MDIIILKKLLALTADPNPKIRKAARDDIEKEFIRLNNEIKKDKKGQNE
jgi:hypothetical protein